MGAGPRRQIHSPGSGRPGASSDNALVDPIARLLASPPDLPVVAALPQLRSLLAPNSAPPHTPGAAAPRAPGRPMPGGAGGLDDAAVERAALTAPTLVVTAPPGTGKTTLVPPLVADVLRAATPVPNQGPVGPAAPTPGAPPNPPGRVIVTQPRRVATRAAARRLAWLLGEEVGATVGYAVRGERRSGPDTRIEVVTAGLLLRRLQADPELSGVDAVVLDEVHERSLDSDLLLALLLDARAALREDLVLVAMSATADAGRLRTLLGSAGRDAPLVEVPGVRHPVTEVWAPSRTQRLGPRGVPEGFLAHVAATTVQALRGDDGDALVFLPGAREVDEVVRRLRTELPGQVDVLPLHGRLSGRAQDAALTPSPPGRRRVVVSTSVAESSLTVPGVRIVVDSTLAREPRLDVVRSISGLVTVGESRSAGVQRAGRAGREGPGVVHRCCTPTDWARASAAPTPEILSADLTGAALELAVWGAPGGAGLAWIDAPPAPALRAAHQALAELGLMDDDSRVTPLGRAAAGLPAGPRLARALLVAAPVLGVRRCAEAVALLSADLRAPGGDLVALARQVRSGQGEAASSWRAEAVRLRRAVEAVRASHNDGDFDALGAPPGLFEVFSGPGFEEAVALVAALARPEWVGRRRGPAPAAGVEAGYASVAGTGMRLPAGSALASSQWLAVADISRLPGRGDALIRAAAPISREQALAAAGAWRVEEERSVWEAGRLRSEKVSRLGAITLGTTPAPVPDPTAVGDAVVAAVRAEGLEVLPLDRGAREFLARLALIHAHIGQPWPAVDEAALLERAPHWLAPAVANLAASGPKRFDIARLDVCGALRALLPWPQATHLDELAPERLAVPSGSRARLSYAGEDGAPLERPVLAVRVQECFGWAHTPRVVNGRVPVLIHLLSPARRPVAVTDDLASFWENSYPQVRAELRGRYPKHAWPTDPWTAPATRATRRRPR